MLKNILKSIIPKSARKVLVSKWENRRHKKYLDKLKVAIFDYYKNKKSLTDEEKEVIDYLKINPIAVFPYAYKDQYKRGDIKIFTDDSNGLKYVLHENKKLYFRRSTTDNGIRSTYLGLQVDQDKESPHLYLTDEFNLDENDVIADIGAAEGNFTLSNIEKVKKAYLFECDNEWIEALQATFKPWAHKIEIFNKFVSNSDSDTTISIDTFTKTNDDITFLKVDIEGEEENFLQGATQFLSEKQNLKMSICTYHKQDDETKFTKFLQKFNFEINPSHRYMIFIYDKAIQAPFFRRAILRCKKV